MNVEDQIKAAVNNGLSRLAIEALLGRPLTKEQQQLYTRQKAVYDLQLRKRRQERKYERLNGREQKRKHDDKACSIDDAMDAALSAVNWERRNRACQSFVDFTNTYMVGLMLEEPPSEKMVEVMQTMEYCLNESRPTQLLLGRGSGKSSISQCMCLWAICASRASRKDFIVVIAQNHASAQQLIRDMFRAVIEPNTLFAQDFPELVLPFQLCTGSYRRRQLYRGQTTDIQKTASQITFARLIDDKGNDMPTSGATIISRGISSGIRGLKAGPKGKRPSLVLLDDLQDAETATSPEQIRKILDIIRADIMNLGGKGRASIIATATSIAPDDLTQQLEQDKGWRTIKYPTVISWPHDWAEKGDKGLWGEYYHIVDGENADDKPHTESRAFYEAHRAEMDAGAELFQPNRYKPEEHASALQFFMDQLKLVGKSAFEAEFQMSPKRMEFKLDVTAKDVLLKVIDAPWLTVPEGYILTVASTDLNVSYGLTTVLVCFKVDGSAHVIWHDIQPCRIPSTLTQAEYNQQVYAQLDKLQDRLLALNVKIDCHAIDGSGIPFDCVTSFCRTTKKIPSCAFLGRASHVFNPFVRSKLRDAVGNTILCGDAQAHAGNSLGVRYVFWDADKYKMAVHKAILAPAGSIGALTIYDGDSKEHSEFSLQLCNEKIVSIQHKQDGRDFFTWKTREPHDFLDAVAQGYAACTQNNILGTGLAAKTITPSKAQLLAKLIRERRKTQFV